MKRPESGAIDCRLVKIRRFALMGDTKHMLCNCSDSSNRCENTSTKGVPATRSAAASAACMDSAPQAKVLAPPCTGCFVAPVGWQSTKL